MKGSKIMLSVFVELSKVFDNTDVNILRQEWFFIHFHIYFIDCIV